MLPGHRAIQTQSAGAPDLIMGSADKSCVQDMVKQMRQDQDLPQGSELWPGLLGSDTPVRLGLSNVAAVSIGATHALALVS